MMKKLCPKLMLTAALLTVSFIQAREARADGPPPAPVISINQMNAYGNDLLVTLWADPTTGDLPESAYVRITDSNGDLVNKVLFTPVPGEQMVWIPGTFTPRPSDVIFPVERDIDVYGGHYGEVFAATGIVASSSGSSSGGVVASKPRRVLAANYCYIHFIKIICYEPESSGSDNALLKLNLTEIWRRWMDRNEEYEMDQWILLEEGRDEFKIELWDDDRHDSDDHLGSFTVGRAETVVPKHYDFKEDGADYRLFYEIRCFVNPLPPDPE